MKKHLFLFASIVAGVVLFSNRAEAQCEATAKLAGKHIVSPFVSDGQTYRALVQVNENAEFHATFFAGTTYRVAAASGDTEGNIIFSLYAYDPNNGGQRQLIYTNSQHNNAPYWDFKVNTTVEVAIEAGLNPSSGKASGCAVVLIGFRQ